MSARSPARLRTRRSRSPSWPRRTRATSTPGRRARPTFAAASRRASPACASRTRRASHTPSASTPRSRRRSRRRCAPSRSSAPSVEEADPELERRSDRGVGHVVVVILRDAVAVLRRARAGGGRAGAPRRRRARAQDAGRRLYSRAAQARGSASGICALLRALRPALDAEHAARRLRGRPRGAARGRVGRGVDAVVSVHLSVQPDATAGGVHSLRTDARRVFRSACRSSARSAPTRSSCARAARSSRRGRSARWRSRGCGELGGEMLGLTAVPCEEYFA